MNRFYTFFVGFLAMAGSVNADSISKSQAMQIAAQFMSNNGMASAAKGNADATVSVAECTDGHYVINSGGGFVVVAADDVASQQVLGYSMSGCYDGMNVPEGMKAMLDGYDREIAYMKANNIKSAVRNTVVREAIDLVTPTWNQGKPYNNLCPLVIEGATDRCATGCGATATAEIMYYHKWPQTAFNWDAMTLTYDDNSSPDACQAVAELMYDIGVNTGMVYGKSSGTNVDALFKAMTETYDYSSDAIVLKRSDFFPDEWEEYVYKNLETYGPLQYNGYGHAFVCDGYKDGYFRFNWGWGGLCNDCYFLLTCITPDTSGIGANEFNDYTPFQSAIFNIHPNDGKTYSWKAAAPTVSPEKGKFVMGDITCSDVVEAYDTIRVSGTMTNPTTGFMMQDLGIVITDKDQDLTGDNFNTAVIYKSTMVHVECNGGETATFSLALPDKSLEVGEYELAVMDPVSNDVLYTRNFKVVVPESVKLPVMPTVEFADSKTVIAKISLSTFDSTDKILAMVSQNKNSFPMGMISVKAEKELSLSIPMMTELTTGKTVCVSFLRLLNGDSNNARYLFYGNENFFEFTVPEFAGIEETVNSESTADGSAFGVGKCVENGRLVIRKNGMTFNSAGQRLY